MANGDMNEKPDPLGTPESDPEAAPERAAPEEPTRDPLAPASEGPAAAPPEPGPAAEPAAPATAAEAPPPPDAKPRAEPTPPLEPAAPASPVGPPPPLAEPPPPSEPATPTAQPRDETADLIRVGKMGSGRRLSPVDEDTLRRIRSFASDRPLPGVGTLLDLARSHATAGRGPGLGVEVFSELRRQLGRIVAELETVAIHAGPVLFLKTSTQNQPGTALRWLSEDERRALREHPELLDHPGRLPANLKKLLAGNGEDT